MLTSLFLLAAATTVQPLPPMPGLGADPDYRFSRAMRSGDVLAIRNIDGTVTVTRASGGTAEVLVTKRVLRGDGDLVRAVLEETDDGIRVCTVYLDSADQEVDGCHGQRRGRHREPLEVEMTYEVRLPAGVELEVGTVDGDIEASGLAARARLSTVDGDVRVRGRAPERVSTVDGNVTLDADGTLPDEMRISTVDGSIALGFPAGAGFEVQATTVDGDMTSDFPITIKGKWGPRTMRGTAGDGRTRIRLSTVDGDVRITRR